LSSSNKSGSPTSDHEKDINNVKKAVKHLNINEEEKESDREEQGD